MIDPERYKDRTPGEWFRTHNNGCRDICVYLDTRGMRRKRFAFALTAGLTNEAEDAANADLMADAPKILEELLATREKVKKLSQDHHANWPACEHCCRSVNQDEEGSLTNEKLRTQVAALVTLVKASDREHPDAIAAYRKLVDEGVL